MTVRRPSARARVVVGVGLLALAAAGCSADSPRAEQSTSPAPASSTLSTAPTITASPTVSAATAAGQAVIQAYKGMWADMVDAARTADYRSPSLAAHTIDPATGQLRRTLLAYSRLGVVVKGTLRTDPHVTSLNRKVGQATLSDCLDDRHWLTYDAKTAKLTDNRPGTRTVTDATLRRVNGEWQVSSYVIHRGQSC